MVSADAGTVASTNTPTTEVMTLDLTPVRHIGSQTRTLTYLAQDENTDATLSNAATYDATSNLTKQSNPLISPASSYRQDRIRISPAAHKAADCGSQSTR